MAQVNIFKKLALVAIALSVVATASAQEAMAPAPSPDAGAAFSLPLSSAVVGSSLLCSAFALLRH
ncbi:hypothetical protein Leryth_012234 [Lithospermum erythrorhizon]|nr:hypothetical protein Leryth_012234 [Lithospermum erythrorhizon]